MSTHVRLEAALSLFAIKETQLLKLGLRCYLDTQKMTKPISIAHIVLVLFFFFLAARKGSRNKLESVKLDEDSDRFSL